MLSACLIACSGDQSGVEIPVGRRATWMIVAHRLLESRIADNGPLATLVAEYALHYEDRDVLKVPVRDRFEISTVPSSYGGTPFVAVPDTNDQLLPRTEGPWDMAGRRQTEVDGGRAQHFVLWAWPNPHPDKELEKIAIEAAGPAFVIGGITLSDLDEEPICREGTREVIITLPQEEDARESAALEVEVDRGVATYPYPLPEDTAEDFINGRKGWGEAQNESSSPSIRGNSRQSFGHRAGQARRGSFGRGRLGRGAAAGPRRGFAASAAGGGGARAQLGAYQGH